MKLTVSRHGTGIVARLRLVSLTIIVLLLVATAVIGVSLSQVKALQREIAERHVPVLAMSSELQTEFAGVYLLAEQLSRTSGYRDMARLGERGGDALRRIERAIERMQHLDVAGPSLKTLSATIAEAAENLDEALRLARRTVSGQRTIEVERETIEEAHGRFRTLVEPAYTSVTHESRRTLERIASENRLEATEHDALERLLLTQESLTALIRGGERVVELASTLTRSGRSPLEVAAEMERIRFGLRNLPTILLRIEEPELRRALAGPLGELRRLILRDAGLLAHVDELLTTEAAMAESRTLLIGTFGNLSTLINRSVDEVESAAAAAALELGRATDLALGVLALTAALVFAVVLWSAYIVLERQINRRIGVLAEEVLRIAAGDDREPLVVGGDDEIGKIARSLKVFRENARELRRSNEELEKFAYAAAHDMRSPLRAIESLATWTLEDAGDALPEDCRDNLVTLLARARRLSTLQSDLLDYARAGEIDGSFADTDIVSLVADLRPLVDPDGQFEIAVRGDTGPLRTHLTPLRQILMNLLANAIRHHDREHGAIEVSVREAHSRVHVAVRDDGPGIDPRFHEKIFGLFATLQSKDVVEGSGLGLSMVRKLVERYDGAIRVESDPESARGTTFTLDLPTQPYEADYRQAA